MVIFIQSNETLELDYKQSFKLVNSMKIEFLFAGLNLNIIFQIKKARKLHVLWMVP